MDGFACRGGGLLAMFAVLIYAALRREELLWLTKKISAPEAKKGPMEVLLPPDP